MNGPAGREGWDRLMAMPIPPDGMSRQAIAEVVGCTPERVRQIERDALAALAGCEAARALAEGLDE